MSWKNFTEQARSVGVEYEGPGPQRDLLNYKYMLLEMTRSANTDSGWSSVIALLVMAFCCVGGFTLLNWISGH
jgi:hypothetical protein